MFDNLDSVRTVDDLREYVHTSLCAQENLLADQFQTQISELTQGGTPCGLQFHLQGPRSVKLSAIWVMQQKRRLLLQRLRRALRQGASLPSAER